MPYDQFKIKVDNYSRPMRNKKYVEAPCVAADKGVVRVPVWNFVDHVQVGNDWFIIAIANPKWIDRCEQPYVLSQYTKFLAEKNRG